jgi:hypothetical protein
MRTLSITRATLCHYDLGVERFDAVAAGCALALVATLAGILTLDHFASPGQQLLIGAAAVALLLAVWLRFPGELKAQVAVVVAMATLFEVIGSVLWGVYRYRLGNLPVFVPPGHGFVYLAGLSLSRVGPLRSRPRLLPAVAIAGGATWAAVGLSGVLGRVDAIGAFGVLVFVVFLLRSPTPSVLAGVFLVVAALEIYGTAIGTWQWAATVPGLGLPDGNPPAGAASGYVMFDLAAIAFAPLLVRLASAGSRRVRGRVLPSGATVSGAVSPTSRYPSGRLATAASRARG